MRQTVLRPSETFPARAYIAEIGHQAEVAGKKRKRKVAVDPTVAEVRSIVFRVEGRSARLPRKMTTSAWTRTEME